VRLVADRVWTSEELEAMTPAEQDAIFESSLVIDVAAVPEAFLERVRSRTSSRVAKPETREQ
jgi:hypothetical protein